MRLEKYRGKFAVRLPDRRRLTTGIEWKPENRDAAERKASEILTAIARQTKTDSLDDIMQAYIADMPQRAKPVIRQDTADYARKALKTYWGTYRISDINYDRCREYIGICRRSGQKDSTIRQRLKYLSAAVNWYEPKNKAQFDFPAPSEPRHTWLTREQVDKLIEAAEPSKHVQTFIRLAIATCARNEALLGLRWSTHVRLDTRMIWLGFKAGGKKRATVPMTDALHTALSEAKKHALTDHVIEYNGKPVKSVRTGLLAAYRRAGISPGRQPAHIFRHSAAVWMAQAGVSMKEICDRMGHSSIAVTETNYARFHPEYMKDSNKALEG